MARSITKRCKKKTKSFLILISLKIKILRNFSSCVLKLNDKKNPLVLLDKMNDHLLNDAAQSSNQNLSMGLLIDFLKNASELFSVNEEDEIEMSDTPDKSLNLNISTVIVHTLNRLCLFWNNYNFSPFFSIRLY